MSALICFVCLFVCLFGVCLFVCFCLFVLFIGIFLRIKRCDQSVIDNELRFSRFVSHWSEMCKWGYDF